MSGTRTAPVDLLVVFGSAHTDSVNTIQARLASEVAQAAGASTSLRTIGDFACPPYDGDLEQTSGLPADAQQGEHEPQGVQGTA